MQKKFMALTLAFGIIAAAIPTMSQAQPIPPGYGGPPRHYGPPPRHWHHRYYHRHWHRPYGGPRPY